MTTAAEMLAKYLAAEAAVLQGKEGRLDGRTLRREDLAEIRKGRAEWEARVNAESRRNNPGATLGGVSFSVANLS